MQWLNIFGCHSFRKSIQALSEMFRDRPQSPLETAIFWTEHVIRHRGEPNLRTAALDLTWYQYFLLDVITLLIVVVILINTSLYFFVRNFCCFCPRSSTWTELFQKIKKGITCSFQHNLRTVLIKGNTGELSTAITYFVHKQAVVQTLRLSKMLYFFTTRILKISFLVLHGKSCIQKIFHKQTGLKFKEEISLVLHLDHSFLWCWNLDT